MGQRLRQRRQQQKRQQRQQQLVFIRRRSCVNLIMMKLLNVLACLVHESLYTHGENVCYEGPMFFFIATVIERTALSTSGKQGKNRSKNSLFYISFVNICRTIIARYCTYLPRKKRKRDCCYLVTVLLFF